MKLVLATANPGKLREIRSMLAALNCEVVAQTDLGVAEASETGDSFVENAIIKARNAARSTGLPALADDSGLEVDALAGQPGIHSARYAGPACDDAANNALLLKNLLNVPGPLRTARFHCVIVFVRHAADPVPLICQASWEGRIGTRARGDNGFGYDPLFEVAGLGCTSAQLPAAKKNRLSHRGQALQQLLQQLPARLKT